MKRRQQRGGRLGAFQAIALAFMAALSGCVIMNKPTPSRGWPELDVTVHRWDSRKDIRDKCASMVTPPLWVQVLNLGITFIEACSWVDLCARTCEVWVHPDDALIEAHELGHCRGHDHVFDSTFEKLLASVEAGACTDKHASPAPG